MSREYGLFLSDIRHACEKVIRYTRGLDREAFRQDEKTFDAVMRDLEIIGEAAKHIPDSIRQKYPDVEWRRICGFRDVVVHEYFGVDMEIVWDIIVNKVPLLMRQIEGILASEENK